ncbi:tyrosine-type recombinase/integrase [Vibrio breoganii]
MTIRKTNDKNKPWIFEHYSRNNNGKPKRTRKKFTTKNEAVIYEKGYLQTLDRESKGELPDNRKLSEVFLIWYNLHGSTLVNGETIYNKLCRMIDAMNDPTVSSFSTKIYTEFRALRLSNEINFTDSRRNKSAPRRSTLNTELCRFKSAINKLIEFGEWEGSNPLDQIKDLKTQEIEMSYLTSEELDSLLSPVEKHKLKDMAKIVKLSLATGARWTEAAEIKGSQLQVSVNQNTGKESYRVQFTATKNRKNRVIPISKELYNEIYKPTSGRLFEEDCYTPFCYILKKKLGKDIPKGQATHILRHTFASHFMMNGGSILVLRDLLGHSDIKMTMRYAHFAPEHLSEALALNPLANI